MRLNRSFGILLAFAAAFGCSKAPRAVYVDLNAILAREVVKAQPPKVIALDQALIPEQVSTLSGTAGKSIPDRAGRNISEATALIQKDRASAIRTLTRRLVTIKNNEIDRQKLAAIDEMNKEQAAYLAEIYDQLFAIFKAYAQKRAPNKFRVEFLKVKKPDLFISKGNPTNFAAKQKEELEHFKSIVKELDAEYEKDASSLLRSAQDRLGNDFASLQAKFETRRANALEEAQSEAKSLVGKQDAALDLSLGRNRSVFVPATPAKQVVIPGGDPLRRITNPLSTEYILSTQERRHGLEQQLLIWLRTQGYNLAAHPSQGVDATDEFEEWRSQHMVGH
jgi:hypothetical protein